MGPERVPEEPKDLVVRDDSLVLDRAAPLLELPETIRELLDGQEGRRGWPWDLFPTPLRIRQSVRSTAVPVELKISRNSSSSTPPDSPEL